MRKKCALILAAGRGKRLGIDKAKCLLEIEGKTLLEMVIENIQKAGIKEIELVLGYQKEEVLKKFSTKYKYYIQKKLLGTANALESAKEKKDSFEDILVIACDMPFISSETIKKAYELFSFEESDLLVTTSVVSNPNGYGRVIRDSDSNIVKILEEIDANESDKKIKEVNASLYIVRSEEVFSYLEKINKDNLQKEFYLTDLIEIYVKEGKKVSNLRINEEEILGINTQLDVINALEILNKKK